MNDLTTAESPPPVLPRRSPWRRRLIAGGILLLLLMLLPGWMVYQRFADEWAAQKAQAEADRLDPGWRFEDLEGARSDVPDEENGALVVLAAHKLLPKNWLPLPTPSTPGLDEAIADLSPELQLNDQQIQDLRAALGLAAPALTPARGLAKLPRGRYTVAWAPDGFGTLMPHIQDARQVAQLLTLDAVLRAQEGDADGAVASA